MLILDVVCVYLHYAAILALAAFLSAEFMLLGGAGTPSMGALTRADAGVVSAGVLVLLSGVVRSGFSSPRGAMFYAGSLAFWILLVAFFVLAFLSIVVSARLARWRHLAKMDPYFKTAAAEVAAARRMVALEMALVLLIPLAAVLMTRPVLG